MLLTGPALVTRSPCGGRMWTPNGRAWPSETRWRAKGSSHSRPMWSNCWQRWPWIFFGGGSSLRQLGLVSITVRDTELLNVHHKSERSPTYWLEHLKYKIYAIHSGNS